MKSHAKNYEYIIMQVIKGALISARNATRCHILRLKCAKFDFGWGSATDPAGELTALL